MAQLNELKFSLLYSKDLGITQKRAKTLIKTFESRLIAELMRGNSVRLDNFGIFEIRIRDKFGNKEYIEPQLNIVFHLSEATSKVLNEQADKKELEKFYLDILEQKRKENDIQIVNQRQLEDADIVLERHLFERDKPPFREEKNEANIRKRKTY